jgi:hypothetical protein
MTLHDFDPMCVSIVDLDDKSTDTDRAWKPKSARYFSRYVVQL